MRDDVMWSDGEPLTAADVAYTYDRDPRRRPRGGDLVVVPQGRRVGRGARRHDGRAHPEEAERRAAAAADPDRARAHLEGRLARRTSRATRPSRRTASRWSAPVPSGWSRAPPAARPTSSRPTPTTGAARRTSTRWSSGSSRATDPAVQALIKGEIDFVDNISALQVQSLEGEDGITAPERRLAGLRRDRLQHRLGRPRDRRADRRPQPRRARPGVPVRPELRRRPRAAASGPSTRAAASPAPRSSRRPTPTTGWSSTTPTRSPSTSTRPASSSTRPATPWARTASARCRTATPSARCGSRRAATRRRRSDVMEFFKEWLGELGIDAEVETYESSKLTDVILEGNFDAFEWGWYVEPDPDSMLELPDLWSARELVGLVVLQRGVRRALRAAARRDGRRGARRTRSSRCRRSSTATRRTW